MKQGRKLTRSEKEHIRSAYLLKPDDWQFLDECRDDDGRPTAFYKIQNKTTSTIKVIDRFKRRAR